MSNISNRPRMSLVKYENVRAPIYAIWAKVVNAGSADEIRAIVRDATPVNVEGGETVGIMRTAVNATRYGVVDKPVNAITFDGEDVILSANASVVGTSNNNFILQMPDGEMRASVRTQTVFILIPEE